MFPFNFSPFNPDKTCVIPIKIAQTEQNLKSFFLYSSLNAETFNLKLNFYFNKLQFKMKGEHF